MWRISKWMLEHETVSQVLVMTGLIVMFGLTAYAVTQ
jgi:hypothetical protein